MTGLLEQIGVLSLEELRVKPCAEQKGSQPTRLDEKIAALKADKFDEDAFKRAVWARDKGRCRNCKRHVVRSRFLLPNRGEVHHVHGKIGVLRFETRAALLTCLRCHERLTGKVGTAKLFIVATKWFRINTRPYTDARAPVIFKEAAA